MKLPFKILLLLLFPVAIAGNKAIDRSSVKTVSNTMQAIVQANQSRLDTIRQLIVVYNNAPADTSAVLVALEKNNRDKWTMKFPPIQAYIGQNGFAPPETKLEGDGKSPTGLFGLGQLFCYDAKVNTQLPFIQVTKDDKWIDDPESADYNTYVRGETTAKSYERLLLKSDAYKFLPYYIAATQRLSPIGTIVSISLKLVYINISPRSLIIRCLAIWII